VTLATERSSREAHATGTLGGPALSAVRANFASFPEQLAGLAPVFERIGQHLDTTVSQPGHDHLFSESRKRVLVGVSDALWGDLVLLTALRADEIRRALTAAALPFTGKQLSDGICYCWADWSRHARKSFRRGVPAWSDLATVSVGGLLFISPEVRIKLAEVAGTGDMPVLAVAMDSTGTTRKRLKCSVRAIVFPLPSWARASGAVSGHA
jgi:hypothetical protein